MDLHTILSELRRLESLVEGWCSQEQISAIESAEESRLTIDGEELTVTPADFIITSEDMPGWQVATEGTLTVALDVTLTEELKREIRILQGKLSDAVFHGEPTLEILIRREVLYLIAEERGLM